MNALQRPEGRWRGWARALNRCAGAGVLADFSRLLYVLIEGAQLGTSPYNATTGEGADNMNFVRAVADDPSFDTERLQERLTVKQADHATSMDVSDLQNDQDVEQYYACYVCRWVYDRALAVCEQRPLVQLSVGFAADPNRDREFTLCLVRHLLIRRRCHGVTGELGQNPRLGLRRYYRVYAPDHMRRNVAVSIVAQDHARERDGPEFFSIMTIPLVYLTRPRVDMYKRIDRRFHQQWARFHAHIVERARIAKAQGDDLALDAALRWFLGAHVVFLRFDGGARGRGRGTGDTVAHRFTSWERGEYAKLVTWVTRASERAAQRRCQRRGPMDDQAKLTRARALIRGRQLGRANRLLKSKGAASLGDEDVVQQLRNKHPQRSEPMPQTVPVDRTRARVEVKLRRRYRRLRIDAGVGPDRWRNEYLRPLAHEYNDARAKEAVAAHETVAGWFLNLELPDWVYEVSAEIKLVALIKAKREGRAPDVRPIGMGGCRQRAWLAQATADVAKAAAAEMRPTQYAIGVNSGLERMKRVIDGHRLWKPNHVLIKIDCANAFNSIGRARTLDSMTRMQCSKNLAPVFWALHRYNGHIRGVEFDSREGVIQGNPLSALAFCCGIHRYISAADRDMQAHDGKVVFGMDDGYIMGPMAEAFRVAEKLADDFRQCNLTIQPTKSEVFAEDIIGLQNYIAANNLRYRVGTCACDAPHYGLHVAGLPTGRQEFVQCQLREKTTKVCEGIKTVLSTLRPWSKQAAYAVLLKCCVPAMGYEMRCIPPDVMHSHLAALDNVLQRETELITSVAFGEPDLHWACRRLRLPKRHGGGGIRLQREVAYAAYVGGVIATVPHLVDRVDAQGAPATARGDHHAMGCWLAGANIGFMYGTETRIFATFMSRAVDMSQAFGQAWTHLQQQAVLRFRQVSEGVLKQPVEKAGTIDGARVTWYRFQHVTTADVEDVQARNLATDMTDARASEVRHNIVRLSVDDYSHQFLGSVPYNEHVTLSNYGFETACAMYFGAPHHRVVQARNGEYIPQTHNVYGDMLVAQLNGRPTVERHDRILYCLKTLLRGAGISHEVEARGLFTHTIAQQDTRNMSDADRRRYNVVHEGLRPDIMLNRPTRSRAELLEVKTISVCRTWYLVDNHAGVRNNDPNYAVERRARRIQWGYNSKARRADVRYNGVPREQDGPCLQELKKFGKIGALAFGAFGEVSKDVRVLVKEIAGGEGQRWKSLGASSYQDQVNRSTARAKEYIGITGVRSYAEALKEGLRKTQAHTRPCSEDSYASFERIQEWLYRYYEDSVSHGFNSRR